MFSPQSILRTLLLHKPPKRLTPVGLASTFPYLTPTPKPSAASGLIFTTTFTFTFTGTSGPMGSRSRSGEPNRDPGSNPRVAQLRELIAAGDYPDGWEKSWEEEITPWDLGRPTPIVIQLVRAQSLPKGRVLVPGCGTGYDVVALAGPERYVVGLDISSTAIKKANELAASCPNKDYFSFLAEDFFTWNPSEPFDLIFDYVFFCALEPIMRSAWAKKISEILKPEGELITLIYVISGQKDGPPFNNDVSDYEDVLYPLGFKQISIEDNELAVGPRKGREKLVRWKRNRSQSHL